MPTSTMSGQVCPGPLTGTRDLSDAAFCVEIKEVVVSARVRHARADGSVKCLIGVSVGNHRDCTAAGYTDTQR